MAKKKKQRRKKRKHSGPSLKNSAAQTVEMGFKHHQTGDLIQAETLYKKALAKDPNNSDAYHFLGIIANQAGNNALAIDLIQKSLTINPNHPVAHNNLGMALEKAGQTDQAVHVYQKAIQLNPDSGDTYKNLGNLLNNTGRLDEAIQCYQKAIELVCNSWDIHNNLGVALEKANRLDEAIDSYKKALAINPDSASTHNNVGNTLVKANRIDEAVASYQKAVDLAPSFVSAWNNLGIILRKSGRLDEAVQCYQKAISLKPDYLDAYNNLGNTFEEMDRLDDAIAAYHKALSIDPQNADAYNNLGVALKDSARLDEAIINLNKAITLRPNFAEAYNNLGNVLEKALCSDEAIANYKKAIEIHPDFAQAHCNLGIELEKTGCLQKAIACFKKAISLEPDYIEAHRHLAKATKHTRYNDDIAAMESLYTRNDLSNEQKMYLCFALGKTFEDLKDFDKSFKFILEANELKRKSYSYSISDDQSMIDSIKKIYNHDFFSYHKQTGCPDKTPIFILGMPRSGSTLIEQILSSHSQVFGAGELEDLALAGQHLVWTRSTQNHDKFVPNISLDEFEKIGADYIQRIRKRTKTAIHITDKMPHNFLHIGLIRAILPNAKIIHSKRDPIDTCLSIFKNYFSEKKSHKYAYNQNELGQYYNLYLDLMKHWQTILPGFVYNVNYEELIDKQEEQTRKLLEFCGLPWDDACMEFHTAKRKVSTASSVQVRQPLYKDSIKLWEQYKTQLEPLRNALENSNLPDRQKDIKDAAKRA